MPSIYNDRIYKDVLEAEVIKLIMDKLHSLFLYELEKLKINQYLLTADSSGIAEAEEGFGIVPNYVTETLEFRRQRVINRNTTKPPYTYQYLKLRLDEIFGSGNYAMNRDMQTRTLYIESSVESSLWYNEISIMVNKLKPANMVYINKPYIKYGVMISETIDYGHRVYNYKLGTKWRLGRLPFALFEKEDTIKVASIKSVQDKYLKEIATFTANEVMSVRINDSIIINDITKSSIGSEGIIEYGVTKEQTTEIRKLELLDEKGEVLTVSTVYVPILDPVRIKHKFLVKEGI